VSVDSTSLVIRFTTGTLARIEATKYRTTCRLSPYRITTYRSSVPYSICLLEQFNLRPLRRTSKPEYRNDTSKDELLTYQRFKKRNIRCFRIQVCVESELLRVLAQKYLDRVLRRLKGGRKKRKNKRKI
jgi:hypothetical protein